MATRSATATLSAAVLAFVLSAGCARKPRAGSDLPLPRDPVSTPSHHAVHSDELQDVMGRLRGLAFERLPQELGSQHRPQEILQNAGAIADQLAQAANRIASVAPEMDLTPSELEVFYALTAAMRDRARELRDHASRGRRRRLPAAMEDIDATCVQCHELFRDPNGPPVAPPHVVRAPGVAADLLRQVRDANRLSGDWGGRRSILEEHGVRFAIFYNQLGARKGEGGASEDPLTRTSGSSDVIGQFDSGGMGLWRGGEALIHMKGDWSRNINPAVGALGEPLDDADGHRVYIDQLWYQHNFENRLVQLRLGYLDQQTILDRNAFANIEDIQFMNTYLDDNNAIVPLAIGPGAAVFLNPTNWLTLVATVSDAKARPLKFSLDTAFDGDYFTYFESDFRTSLPSRGGPLAGNYRFGFFLDPREPAFVAEPFKGRSNRGAYASLDQWLFAERNDSSQGLGVFARLGWRPSRMNRISRFVSAGAQYAGPFQGRPRDVLGVAFHSSMGSDLFREQVEPGLGDETGYELYYSIRLSPAITLSPGFQRLRRPGANRGRQSVSVAALRLRFIL